MGIDSVREPPMAPEALPLVGHIRGLMREKYEFYPRISKKCETPIFTLKVPGQKMYVVTTPDLIAKVQKASSQMSFSPIRAKFSSIVFGASAEAREIAYRNMDQEEGNWGLAYDSHHAFVKGLRPGDELDKLTRDMLQNVAECLDSEQPAHGIEGTLKLNTWLRDSLTAAATDALYGPENPFRDPEVADAFWTFESKMMSLLVSPLPYIFARSAIDAREKVASAVNTYFTNGGLETASYFTRIRYEAWKQNAIPPMDLARYEVGSANAALINTIPASFWMLFHIFSDPELLINIRAELDRAMVITTSSSEVVRTLDTTGIKKSCPLLMSTFQEMLRFTAIGTSVREVLEDTVFDNQWHLEKGALVQMPIRCIHTDETIWGLDVNDFNARRFIKGEKQKTPNGKRPNDVCFRTFGGGSHLCPGRHFATNEVLAVTSLFVARYDMKPADGEWERPSTFNTNAASTIMEPDTDINVKITRRVGYEDGKWAITLVREEKPFAIVAEDLQEE